MSENIYQPKKRTPDKDTLRKFKKEFYIDQYGDLRNKIDRGIGHKKDQLAGKFNKGTGYIFVFVNGYLWLIHCIVDYLHNGDWYPDIIDHIDRNTLHNNIHNLERSNIKENTKNKSLNTNNTSGVTGIINDGKHSRFLCQYNINDIPYKKYFSYLSKNRKRTEKTNYYWSSYESAWEAAQLFNWLIRKQNGFSIDHLPEIKIDLNRPSKTWIDWDSDDVNDIPGISKFNIELFYRIKITNRNKKIIQNRIYFNNEKRKRKKNNQYYWKNEKEAFEIAKLYNYLLRKKYNLYV